MLNSLVNPGEGVRLVCDVVIVLVEDGGGLGLLPPPWPRCAGASLKWWRTPLPRGKSLLRTLGHTPSTHLIRSMRFLGASGCVWPMIAIAVNEKSGGVVVTPGEDSDHISLLLSPAVVQAHVLGQPCLDGFASMG